MTNVQKLQSTLCETDAALILDPYNRAYYSGMESSEGAVIVFCDRAWFYTDFRYISDARRSVRDMEVCLLSEPVSEVFARLAGESGVNRVFYEEKFVTCAMFEALRKGCPNMEFAAGSDMIASPRAVKSDEELGLICAAQDIADKGFDYICGFIRDGRSRGITEKQIALELEYFLRRSGSGRMPFDIICASGPNSACPHAVPTDRQIRDGDFITLDYGCTVGGYCSDMTRTVAVGSVSDRMREVYQLVLQAQQRAMSVIKAGVDGRDVDAAARELFRSEGLAEYFGHSLGHSVGLYIHEEPCFSPSRSQIIPQGAVISVEPGLYFDGQFGVRIEDIVCVTAEGLRDLASSPKDLLEL